MRPKIDLCISCSAIDAWLTHSFEQQKQTYGMNASLEAQGKAPDPGSGGKDKNITGVSYPGNLKPAADDAGADLDEVAGAEVAEPRGGGAREALDEEVEGGGGGPGRRRRGRDGEEDGVGRGGEAEGEELAGGGVGGEEVPVRGEVEGDVVERGVGGGRADGGERRLGPLGGGLGRGRGRGRGRRGGGKRRGGEGAEVVRAEEVEAARRGA